MSRTNSLMLKKLDTKSEEVSTKSSHTILKTMHSE